jgi:hypothetical protein
MRRIEVGGGVLPDPVKNWLYTQSAQVEKFPDMTIDEGFQRGVSFFSREAEPDSKFDKVSGIERLKALEVALGTGRRGWDDDPADRANDWINQLGNTEKLLADFEVTDDGGNAFPKVWSCFGWAHKPRQQDSVTPQDAVLAEVAGLVLGLLNQLADATISNSIEGICAWLDAWDKHVVSLPLALPIWLRLWPIAADFTNQRPEENSGEELTVIVGTQDTENDRHGSAALNTPAGKLAGVFFAAWRLHTGPLNPFHDDGKLREMRDTMISTEGRSGLLIRYRMIEYLPFFLSADPDWTKEHLLEPLLKDDSEALALWRAVARRTHFAATLKTIGSAMAERANDRRLGRETRRRLVFNLVVESLHAFREGRGPAVPNQRIAQMLRTLDDEVRAFAAKTIQQFVSEMSAETEATRPEADQQNDDKTAPEALFRAAALPFLREVWPQERSLATSGVSKSFASLPATSGEAFAEAVEVIERFLVPFDCWSMLDYGLYGEKDNAKKLSMINGPAKALALLKLLDFTVGASEGAVVPHDLTDALDQIIMVAPALVDSIACRRLSTAARR